MNAFEAVGTALRRTFDFHGRSGRSEYWWFELVLVTVFALLASEVEVAVQIATAIGLLTLVPSLSLTVRRLHDTDRSAWYLLLFLVPILGGIALTLFSLQDSTSGANRYGPSPKRSVAPGQPVTYTSPRPRGVFVDQDGNAHTLPDSPPLH